MIDDDGGGPLTVSSDDDGGEFSAFLEAVPGAVLHGPSIFNRPFKPMEAAGEVSQNVSHMPHFDNSC
jgi:hypothetical protein